MFKRLGIFAVLAVCLFAIVIVMVGCGNGEDDEETPMEKLTGSYEFSDHVTANRVPLVGGSFSFGHGGNNWSLSYLWDDGRTHSDSGPTWSASATTITFTNSTGLTWTDDYTLVGEVLTFFYDDNFTEWRKE